MILDKRVKIKICSKNYNYYKSKNYEFQKVGDIIYVNIEDLSKGSSLKVKVKCDNCDVEKMCSFYDYNKITNDGKEQYFCFNCKGEKTKNTLKSKGVTNVFQLDSVKEKIKKTNLEKYGVEYPMQNDCIKRKSVETSLSVYGTEHPMKSESVKKKMEETNLEKYGTKSSSQNEKVKEKVIQTNNLLYGVDYTSKNKDVILKIQKKKLDNIIQKYSEYNIISIDYDKKIYKLKCDCGLEHDFEISPDLFRNRKKIGTIICTECNKLEENSSGEELQLFNFIKDNIDGQIITNNRNIIKPYELDIYLPDLKLSFEFNGLYWHSELYKDKNYHYQKLQKCIDNNIKLIQIWEDDWLYKKEIVKSRILNLLGKTPNKIWARKCEIREIKDSETVTKFLDDNHIQGSIGSLVKLGLFHHDELVSLMCFSKLRKSLGKNSSENEYELIRFCNKNYYNVIGGASKLFSFFIKNYQYQEIISYADRCWSDGNLYQKLNFELDKISQPNYYYIIDKIRKHRFNFRKDKLIKEGFNPNKTEHDIMLERKIFRIYDAGHLKYRYKKREN